MCPGMFIRMLSENCWHSPSTKNTLEEGDPFVTQYIELLSSGGNDTPTQLLRKLDIEIEDPHFWLKGLDIIDNLLKQTEQCTLEFGSVNLS